MRLIEGVELSKTFTENLITDFVQFFVILSPNFYYWKNGWTISHIQVLDLLRVFPFLKSFNFNPLTGNVLNHILVFYEAGFYMMGNIDR